MEPSGNTLPRQLARHSHYEHHEFDGPGRSNGVYHSVLISPAQTPTINSRFFHLKAFLFSGFTILARREQSETPRKSHQSGEKRRKINEKSITQTTLVSSITFLKSNFVFFFFLLFFWLKNEPQMPALSFFCMVLGKERKKNIWDSTILFDYQMVGSCQTIFSFLVEKTNLCKHLAFLCLVAKKVM